MTNNPQAADKITTAQCLEWLNGSIEGEINMTDIEIGLLIGDKLEAAEVLAKDMERLASPEAFVTPRVASEEETARMKFAQTALSTWRDSGGSQ